MCHKWAKKESDVGTFGCSDVLISETSPSCLKQHQIRDAAIDPPHQFLAASDQSCGSFTVMEHVLQMNHVHKPAVYISHVQSPFDGASWGGAMAAPGGRGHKSGPLRSPRCPGRPPSRRPRFGPLFKTHSLLQPLGLRNSDRPLLIIKSMEKSISPAWRLNPHRSAAALFVWNDRDDYMTPITRPVLHRLWFMDNPSAYMFLQDNIGFGKSPPPHPWIPAPHIGSSRMSSRWNITYGAVIAFPSSSSSGRLWRWRTSRFISHNCRDSPAHYFDRKQTKYPVVRAAY